MGCLILEYFVPANHNKSARAAFLSMLNNPIAVALPEDKQTWAINDRLYRAPQPDFNSNSAAGPIK
jgi:hypothetical protein